MRYDRQSGCGNSLYLHNAGYERLAFAPITHPLAPLDLPGREPIAPAGIRIRFGNKLKPDGGAGKPKDFANPVDQKAAITVRHMLGLITMNYDQRRVSPALMGITKLDTPSSNHGRGMFRHDIFE